MPDAVAFDPTKDEGNNSGGIQVTDEQIAAMAKKSGDSEEHIRDMLGLAEKGLEKHTQDKLAGKFANDEALNKGIENITSKLNVGKEDADKLINALGAEKAYEYWQSQLGKGKSADGSVENQNNDGQVDALNKDGKSGDDAQADNSSQFDIDKYSKEYQESGKLSEASYKELSDKGIPKAMVDAYISGVQAQATLFVQGVEEVAGGEQAYDAIVSWASENLNAAEKQRFNDALDTYDLETVRPLMEALKARYERAEGSFSRKSVEGSQANSGLNVQGYESVAEMQRDMRDPRYGKDTAFMEMVKQRIKFTKAF